MEELCWIRYLLKLSKNHVLFKTSKSSKPPLDRVKVGLMFGKYYHRLTYRYRCICVYVHERNIYYDIV